MDKESQNFRLTMELVSFKNIKEQKSNILTSCFEEYQKPRSDNEIFAYQEYQKNSKSNFFFEK